MSISVYVVRIVFGIFSSYCSQFGWPWVQRLTCRLRVLPIRKYASYIKHGECPAFPQSRTVFFLLFLSRFSNYFDLGMYYVFVWNCVAKLMRKIGTDANTTRPRKTEPARLRRYVWLLIRFATLKWVANPNAFHLLRCRWPEWKTAATPPPPSNSRSNRGRHSKTAHA